MTIFFASDEFFCQLFFFLPTINFYRQTFLPIFFLQTQTFSISNLKTPLVYLFDFKFD